MPANFTYNVGQSRTLDRPVKRIDVHVGSLTVQPHDGDPFTLGADDKPHYFDPPVVVTTTAPVNAGARVGVFYYDEDVPAPPKPKRVRKPKPKAKAKPKPKAKAKSSKKAKA